MLTTLTEQNQTLFTMGCELFRLGALSPSARALAATIAYIAPATRLMIAVAAGLGAAVRTVAF